MADSLLVRVGALCLLPLLSADILSGLDLFSSSEFCYSFFEIIYVSVQFCVEDAVYSKSTITICSYSLCVSCSTYTSETGGKEFDEDILFRTEIPMLLFIVKLWFSVLILIYCKKNFV